MTDSRADRTPAEKQASQAEGPTELPAESWKDVLKRTWGEAGKDNVGLVAAGVAFYGFLAFVPLLAAVVLTYGLVADPASVADHIRSLAQTLPQDAASLIGDQLRSMVESASGTKGFALLLAILVSLYGAMRGASSLITALNVVYDVKENRSFVRSTLIAAAITVGAVVAFIIGIVAISALAALEALLPFTSSALHFVIKLVSWILAALAVSLVVALIYRYAPNRPETRWEWLTPGSIGATLLWLAATLAFGFYVSSFGSYNATYGSLGAVVVFLTWLYLSAYIILMGAELNSELEKETDRDTVAR